MLFLADDTMPWSFMHMDRTQVLAEFCSDYFRMAICLSKAIPSTSLFAEGVVLLPVISITSQFPAGDTLVPVSF